mmetsp:Transcript_6199/g.5324  ORF Transcript_6199/g.5324 Transcript_6199/m.5324 type:complete len:222 (+) Transcript_6199:475-1140(+)
MTVYVVNSYFDAEDYNDPIKTYIDDRFIYSLIPGYTKLSSIYIQKNEIEDQTSYLAYKPGGKVKSNIEINRFDNSLSIEGTETNNIFKALFLKDNFSKSYDRSVITLLDVFGNVGGIMSIISLVGAIIVGFFSDKIFIYSILSKLYQVDDDTNHKKNTSISKVIQEGGNKNRITKKQSKPKKENEKELVSKAHQQMRRRLRYDWNIADFIYNCLSLFSFLC